MLTLEELKKMVGHPAGGGKLPTAKELKETGISVVKKKIDGDTEIGVYQPKSRIIVERKNWDITFPVFVKIIDLYL